jgi:hypothetical protein
MLNKKRVILATLGAVAAISLVLTQTAGTHRQYKLGGGFIGNNGGENIWNCLQIPLDAAGRTAALRVTLTSYGPTLAGLIGALGGDTFTESVGEEAMTGRDTAAYSTVAYINQQGNPPTLRAIAVMNGTLTFSTQDDITVNYTIDVYPVNVPGVPINADANADGYPDEGAVPLLSIPGEDYATRVPLP